MSTQVQYRRGTAAENDAFTGALAEMTIDTTNGTIRVHNGVTAGGSNIATVAYVAAQIGSLSANSISSGTSNVKLVSSGGNATISIGGTANVAVFATTGGYVTGIISATGNITGGNLTVSTGTVTVGNIVNSNGNGVGNIGSSTTYFNTVFAKATSAQYADLAEMYVADQQYLPGTVLEFGGNDEVTASAQTHSTRVAGIVSTNPSYLMNATQTGINVVAVALVGRVPCQVVGTIAKGDRLVASDISGVATRLDPALYQPACIIGKALEAYESDTVGIIEVAVGRT